MRDENHHAWWEYPLMVGLAPLAALFWLTVALIFVTVVVPIGIVGSGLHWLKCVGR